MISVTLGYRGKSLCLPFKERSYSFSVTPFWGAIFLYRGLFLMTDQETILAKIKELSKKGRLSCTDARKIAAEQDIPLGKMADLCNEIGIKIYACELGCF
jgi:hypothetical protein